MIGRETGREKREGGGETARETGTNVYSPMAAVGETKIEGEEEGEGESEKRGGD